METAQRNQLLAITALVLLPLIAYGIAALRSDFVSLDDTLLITGNANIQEFTPRSVWKIFTSYDPELYVPLTLLSYQIEHAMFGLHPIPFHITNLLLHIGSTLLLFALMRLLLKNTLAALVVAALWALHPLNTEAVVWAAARKDVLSTFFFLLSLFLYERSQETDRAKFFLWSIVAFAAALLSKVTVITLPVVLLLMDWRAGRTIDLRAIRSKWPYFGLAVLFAVIAYFGKTRNLGSLGVFDYLLVGCKSIAFYLGKLFWPVGLTVAYPQTTPITIASVEFALPLLLVIALLAAAVVLRRQRAIAFGLLFFLITVSANFFNVWKNGMLFFASDRYAYIPSIGIFFVIVLMLMRWRVLLPAGAALAVLVLTPLTFVQAAVWRGSETLYRHALKVTSGQASVMILNNLGDVLVDSNRVDEGLALFLRATEVDPRNIVALTNAGNIYKQRGDLSKAAAFYRQAAQATPPDPFPEHLMGHYLLGELFIEQGKVEEGLSILREATVLGKKYAEPFFNLGLMLEKQGRKAEATEVFRQAVATNGNYLIARYHLSALLAEQGNLDEAIAQLEAIVALNPHYEKAAEHLEAMRNLRGR